MTSLREEIEDYFFHMPYRRLTDMDGSKIITNDMLKLFKKRIDKVEQDYKSELNDWGKQQPMSEMYPKEMDALDKVRKQLTD
jgi:hypothetical protein